MIAMTVSRDILESILEILEERVHATMGVYRVCQCDACRVYYWAEDTMQEMEEQS